MFIRCKSDTGTIYYFNEQYIETFFVARCHDKYSAVVIIRGDASWYYLGRDLETSDDAENYIRRVLGPSKFRL